MTRVLKTTVQIGENKFVTYEEGKGGVSEIELFVPIYEDATEPMRVSVYKNGNVIRYYQPCIVSVEGSDERYTTVLKALEEGLKSFGE